MKRILLRINIIIYNIIIYHYLHRKKMGFNEICNVLNKLCTQGDLLKIQTMPSLKLKHFRHDNNLAFRVACHYGHLEIAKWIVDKFELTIEDVKCENNYAFRCSCYNEHLNILQFLIGNFQLTEDDYNQHVNSNWTALITKACEEKNRFMVSWFVDNFPINEIPEECKMFAEEVFNENEIMIKPASKTSKD